MINTIVLVQDEVEHLQRLRALLAIGWGRAARSELIESMPEPLDEIDRKVDERFGRAGTPNPAVCP